MRPQQIARRFIAAFHRRLAMFYPTIHQMDACLLQSGQKTFAPSGSAIGCRRTGKKADLPMPALDEMMGSQPAAPFIIERDTIEVIFDGLVEAAIDEHNCWQISQDFDQ